MRAGAPWRSPRAIAVGGLAIAVVAGAVSVSQGQTERATGRIIACADRQDGQLRIVRHAHCKGGERKLTWNRRGPEGARGATGSPGQAGPAGQPGARGDRGNFDFDSFDGMACTGGTNSGSVDLTYDSDGFASFRC